MPATAFSAARRTRTASCNRAQRVRALATPDRRQLLLAGASVPAALAAAPGAEALEKFDLPVSQLSTFERVEQRDEVAKRASDELRKLLTDADSKKALRLVLNDAATYDAATKTGGFDASIILNKEEASRPENAGLQDFVAKLTKAKAIVDEGNAKLGSGPISYSDMMVLALKVTTEAEWKKIKISRAAVPSGGEQIAKTFGSAWDVKLGRIDSADAGGNRALPAGASANEVKDFYNKLGAKPGAGGPFSPKPPFWEKYAYIVYSAAQDDPSAMEAKLAASPDFAVWKENFDQSRRTVTRTNYEVDFINTVTKLTALGAKFDPDAYLHSRPGFKLA